MSDRIEPLRTKLESFLSLLFILALSLLLALMPASRAWSQSLQLIRDAEIESTIRLYATPIFRAAGLNPEAINVYLIQDESLNAFVAGGQNMFLHTGLLQRAESADQVMGVIAHETGHIAGGHLSQRRQEMQQSATQMLASTILGLGAAVLTGRGDVGAAIMSGGQGAALTNLLQYSRSQEQAADAAAVNYLAAAELSPQGLLEFMEILEGQELLMSSNQDPYIRTHPLTQDRIAFLRRAVNESHFGSHITADDLRERHDRMVAKLIGFLAPRDQVRRHYPESDQSVPARYAHAIAAYRASDLATALSGVDALIADYPQDPFFHELRGQMLFENGRIADALPSYERAVELEPEEAMLRLGLARTQLQLNDPALNEPGLENVNLVLQREPENATAWRLAAIAHGRAGDTGSAALALAERYLVIGDLAEARNQARRAQALLEENTPPWLRAQDLEIEAERLASRRR